MSQVLIAIYDFEFFPYALGDVLTWNIRTAMRCKELNKSKVDVYICLDKNYPASIYQRGLVNPENFELFFYELYSAFSTNPLLGNIHIYRDRNDLTQHLKNILDQDKCNTETINDYFKILQNDFKTVYKFNFLTKLIKKISKTFFLKKIFTKIPKKLSHIVQAKVSDEYILNDYFIKYIHSHETINQFYAKHNFIPYLRPVASCSADIDEFIAKKLKNKKIVTFHLRLRSLDVGYGGDHSYARDSNFLEWYDFLKKVSIDYPDIQFIALGRLQEKPLEILNLPNVMSLRTFGMGLGHELTLMFKSDLFIGSSSGFAALANFSALPYFITRMNPSACHAYAIAEGVTKLPFAKDNQILVYEEETSELLLNLLKMGLNLNVSKEKIIKNTYMLETLDIKNWIKDKLTPFFSARTTTRFVNSESYTLNETAFLVLPYIEKARKEVLNNNLDKAKNILFKIKENFPSLSEKFYPYLVLVSYMAYLEKNVAVLQSAINNLKALDLSGINKVFAKFLSKDFFDNEHFNIELKKILVATDFMEIVA